MNYHIARDGQQLGSFSETETRSRFQSGEFQPNDLCWVEGMSEWKPLGAVFSSAPALPSTAAPINPFAPPAADVTPPSHANRPPLAGLGQRLGAAMLDGLFGFIAALPLIIGASMLEGTGGPDSPPEFSTVSVALMGIGGLLLLIMLIYNLVLLSTQGQTLGKKMLGIRIVTYTDDSQAGFVRAVLLRIIVNAFIGFIPFYGLVDICFIFGEERRCIHDYVAGTRVVQA